MTGDQSVGKDVDSSSCGQMYLPLETYQALYFLIPCIVTLAPLNVGFWNVVSCMLKKYAAFVEEVFF
jgi:hypothetical protein